MFAAYTIYIKKRISAPSFRTAPLWVVGEEFLPEQQNLNTYINIYFFCGQLIMKWLDTQLMRTEKEYQIFD